MIDPRAVVPESIADKIFAATVEDGPIVAALRRHYRLQRLRALSVFRALHWYRRAWLTLTGKAPR